MKGDAKVHALIVMDAGERTGQQVSAWFVIIFKSRVFSGRFGFFSGVFSSSFALQFCLSLDSRSVFHCRLTRANRLA